MVPTNQPLPVQQRSWHQAWNNNLGLPGGTPPNPPYTIAFKLDNWVYFGQTGFRASSDAHHGQIPAWRPLTYLTSQGGNNAGTANPGPSQRVAYRGYVDAR